MVRRSALRPLLLVFWLPLAGRALALLLLALAAFVLLREPRDGRRPHIGRRVARRERLLGSLIELFVELGFLAFCLALRFVGRHRILRTWNSRLLHPFPRASSGAGAPT